MAQRPKRSVIALTFLAVLLSTVILVDPDLISFPFKGPALGMAAALFAALGANIVSDYIAARSAFLKERESETQKQRDESVAADFENLELSDLKEQLAAVRQLIAKIGENELQAIAEQLRSSLAVNAAEDFVAELKRKAVADDKVRQIRISTKSAFTASEGRLSSEVEMLRARSTTNMIIGVFIALFGAVILVLALFSSDIKFANLTELALHMTPRISVVVLVEIFAYFFLSMYRSNLAEIRYYQNEITNIEMKKVGALLAIASASTDGVSKLLSETDRNSVMKSDQTTQELERLKIERASMKSTLDTLTSFLRKRA